jgi:hypothetical protein
MCTLFGLWPVRIPSDLYYVVQDLRDRCVLSILFFILVYSPGYGGPDFSIRGGRHTAEPRELLPLVMPDSFSSG